MIIKLEGGASDLITFSDMSYVNIKYKNIRPKPQI